jgi:hypothetical protein
MSLQETIERNDRVREQIRVALRAKTNLTTRAISKATGVDKRILNQILYITEDFVKNEDRIPKWSLVVAPPRVQRPRPRASQALLDHLREHPFSGNLPPIRRRTIEGRLYYYLASENPELVGTLPLHEEHRLRRLPDANAEEAREAEDAEDAEQLGDPVLDCSSCGVSDELVECSEGPLCHRCADEIDAASGKRRREM